jgi:hypothetical protein
MRKPQVEPFAAVFDGPESCTLVGQTSDGLNFTAKAPSMEKLTEGVGRLATQLLSGLIERRKTK